MMKILIATDGSNYSQAAIEKACQTVVNTAGCQIEIVSVFEVIPYTGIESLEVSTEYIVELEKIGRDQATKYANDAEATIRGRFPDSTLQIMTKIVQGSAGRVIVEEAQNWGADVVIVGSHGYGFWSRAFLGSVSNSVVNHAPCSVLIVRSKGNK